MAESYSFIRSYIRGEALFGFWNFVSKGIGAVVSILLITVLSVHDYGVFLLVISAYAFAGGFFLDVLADVILSDVSRFIGEGREADAKRLFLENAVVRMGCALLLTLGFLFGAELIAAQYSADVAGFIRLIAPMFLIEAAYGSMKVLIEARLKFGVVAVRPIVYKTLRLLFMAGFVFFSTLGVYEALLVHVIASGITVAIFLPVFIRIYTPWRRITATSSSVLWPIVKTYGKWPVMSQIVSQASTNIRPWLIKWFVSTEAVAIFSVAESLFGVVKSFVPSSTLAALIPRTVTERERAAQVLLRGTKLLTLLSVVVAFGSAIAVPIAVGIVLPHYLPSLPLFYVLLAALPLLVFRIMGVTFLVAFREQKYLFLINIIKIGAGFALPIGLLYFFGVFGMAFERIAGAALIAALTFSYLLRHFVPRESWRLVYTFDRADRDLVQMIAATAAARIGKKFTKMFLSYRA